jgi:hypothetical protein
VNGLGAVWFASNPVAQEPLKYTASTSTRRVDGSSAPGWRSVGISPCVCVETQLLMVLAAPSGSVSKSTCCKGASYPADSTERNVDSNAVPCWPQSELAMESTPPFVVPSVSS